MVLKRFNTPGVNMYGIYTDIVLTLELHQVKIAKG
jgi:hypothetical protein